VIIDDVSQDVLSELVSLGLGKAGSVLNEMLDAHITLRAPRVVITSAEELPVLLSSSGVTTLSGVHMRYAGNVNGAVELIFRTVDAGKLIDRIVGEESIVEEGLDAIRAGALCEIGNVVINALLGTISNQLALSFSYSVPSYFEGAPTALISEAGIQHDHLVILAETEFSVEDISVLGSLAVFFSIASFANLLEALSSYAKQNGLS